LRIILISHGETETHESSNGASPLTATGVQQAQALADELRATVARRSVIE
jgi:broad specificity phosphatase PhoE